MVDTGFNGQLALPAWVIERLGLRFQDETHYILADGESSTARIFQGEIDWNGAWREILIVQVEGDSLLGMELMRNCNLSMDVQDGGTVWIRPLLEASN